MSSHLLKSILPLIDRLINGIGTNNELMSYEDYNKIKDENKYYYVNPETGDVYTYKRGDNYYKGCGCRLQAKTRLVNAHCPAKKW